ncbi:hypothetical protein HO133_008969 [Letharia lupina]|uniref:Fe2OG dioxygenase domain-containing protein n=1 Tax=Letharia lupina TaxID=560253 RepID=A0A8H6CMR8_9LECA|nr:uncharacterized protein HO133_008969 [Letharia lupina]KAF6226104.1 hypothetical protein HO133_008969 [Letharia lupina]
MQMPLSGGHKFGVASSPIRSRAPNLVMAELETISLSQLLEVDPQAMKELEDAATLQGFFYLDLRGSETSRTLRDVDECVETAGEFYAMPFEEKLGYDIDKLGMHKLNGSLLERLMNDLHAIGISVLRALSLVLRIPVERSLEMSHRHHCSSTSALGVLKYPRLWAESPQLGHGAHTDVGSLTLLFCSEPGLQILDPKTDQWAYIRPKDGHAIVNVGDSLRFLSDHRLRSCLHRVVPPVEGKITDRLSCACFLRPELDAVFMDDTGKSWKSVDWHDGKYKMFRAPTEKQQQDSVLTGKAGFLGSWCPDSIWSA